MSLDESLKEIQRIAATAHFVSAESLSWEGHVVPVKVVGDPPAQAEAYPPIVKPMTQYLYAGFYVRPMPWLKLRGKNVPKTPSVLMGSPDPVAQEEWLQALDHANATTVAWQPGWRRLSVADGQATVEREGKQRTVAESAFREKADGVGELQVEKGSSLYQPGWYYVNGARGYEPGAELLRVYWNVARVGALLLVRRLSGELNDAGVRYKFKIASHPGSFNRADSCVLYVPLQEWGRAAPALRRVEADVARYLRAVTPMFTRRLAPGVGLAQDPNPQGESFGMNRCGLVAQGLWDAHQAGASTPEERAAAIVQRFEREGVSLARPHLRPGRAEDPAEAYLAAPREAPVLRVEVGS